MAFCNKCGNQLTGNEKFCAQCGADVSARPASAPTPSAPTVAPAPSVAAIPVQPVVSAPLPPPPPPIQPVHYAPVGPTPVAIAYPPPQQAGAKKGGMMGTVVVVLIVAAIGYYYYNKSHVTPTPTPTPIPQPTPQPGPTPPPSSGGDNKALQAQQSLSAQWQTTNGFIVVTAKWTNNATVNMASAAMECDQYNAGGTQLAQFRVTLNGPTPPNTWSSYSNVQMGEAAADVSKLNCNIVHVTPAN